MSGGAASLVPDVTKLDRVFLAVWRVVKTGFASRPLLWCQVGLWAIAAFIVAVLREMSPSPGGKTLAVLAGSSLLLSGYVVMHGV